MRPPARADPLPRNFRSAITFKHSSCANVPVLPPMRGVRLGMPPVWEGRPRTDTRTTTTTGGIRMIHAARHNQAGLHEDRIALVHDYLLVLRGAERTFAAMADVWPGAPIATLLYDEEATEGRFSGHPVTTSPLQRLGLTQRSFRRLLPVFPTAVRRLDLSDFDCVVSSSSAFAHGVRPAPGARHVCYCHSPFRY